MERSWESLTRRQGWVEMWTFGGREVDIVRLCKDGEIYLRVVEGSEVDTMVLFSLL